MLAIASSGTRATSHDSNVTTRPQHQCATKAERHWDPLHMSRTHLVHGLSSLSLTAMREQLGTGMSTRWHISWTWSEVSTTWPYVWARLSTIGHPLPIPSGIELAVMSSTASMPPHVASWPSWLESLSSKLSSKLSQLVTALVHGMTDLVHVLAVADMQTFKDDGLVKDDSDRYAHQGEVVLLTERADDISLAFILTTFSGLECRL